MDMDCFHFLLYILKRDCIEENAVNMFAYRTDLHDMRS